MGAIFSPTRDKNEPAIIRALEAVGCYVQKLHEGGVPDLLVGYEGCTFLLEVKGALGVKGGASSVSLTETQEKWHRAWCGARPFIVRTVEDALTAIGLKLVAPGMWRDREGKIQTYPRGDVRPAKYKGTQAKAIK